MTKIVGATALGFAVVIAIPVLGHGGSGMYGPQNGGNYGHRPDHMGMHGQMHNGPMHPGHMHQGGNVEQQLGSLKNALKLTTEQQPAWDLYEQAVKTLVDSHPHWGNAQGDAESHFAQMERHFANMKTVFETRKALYETLTDQQKETINNTMPGPMGHHFGYHG